MRSKSPNLNSTGTSFQFVPVYASSPSGHILHGTHSPPYRKMMKIVDRYMKAGFTIDYKEFEYTAALQAGADFGYHSAATYVTQLFASVTIIPSSGD